MCGVTGNDTSLSTCPTFFFQAEDGIRATSVTGVQTCALPISSWLGIETALECAHASGETAQLREMYGRWPFFRSTRSEERRVGEEYSYRWGREQRRRKALQLALLPEDA